MLLMSFYVLFIPFPSLFRYHPIPSVLSSLAILLKVWSKMGNGDNCIDMITWAMAPVTTSRSDRRQSEQHHSSAQKAPLPSGAAAPDPPEGDLGQKMVQERTTERTFSGLSLNFNELKADTSCGIYIQNIEDQRNENQKSSSSPSSCLALPIQRLKEQPKNKHLKVKEHASKIVNCKEACRILHNISHSVIVV